MLKLHFCCICDLPFSVWKQGIFSISSLNFNFSVCVLAGAIVLLSLAFLMPVFYYIPKASLAAVIICAVAPMMDFHVVANMWRIRSKCLLSFSFTLKRVSLLSVYSVVMLAFFHRAGPAHFYGDVPDEFLAGAVWHHRRCIYIWSPTAVQYGETPDKGNIIFCTGLWVWHFKDELTMKHVRFNTSTQMLLCLFS